MCGEKTSAKQYHSAKTGSPPRMRGKVPTGLPSVSGSRITPAYAGKSSCVISGSTRHGDHPRVCGEKLDLYMAYVRRKGSPPRMRGKVQIPEYIGGQRRITPAYAGKSPGSIFVTPRKWDHPRMCGEKHQLRRGVEVEPGITPACAGKREHLADGVAAGGDHPRMCGEKSK